MLHHWRPLAYERNSVFQFLIWAELFFQFLICKLDCVDSFHRGCNLYWVLLDFTYRQTHSHWDVVKVKTAWNRSNGLFFKFTVITLCFRTPFALGHPLFVTEIIIFSVPKHVFRTSFVFGHPLFFTKIIIFSVRKHRLIAVLGFHHWKWHACTDRFFTRDII